MTGEEINKYGKLPKEVLNELSVTRYGSERQGEVLKVCKKFKGDDFVVNDVVVEYWKSTKSVLKRSQALSYLGQLTDLKQIKRVSRGTYRNVGKK